MKIKSVELRENASNVGPSAMTTVLLPEAFEFELLESGWLRWRTKRMVTNGEKTVPVYGEWHRCPPEMIRCVREDSGPEKLQNAGTSELVPTNSNMSQSYMRQRSRKT